MPATTDDRAYPYPQSSDDYRPHEDIQALAEAVDNDVDAIHTTLDPMALAYASNALCFLEQQSAQSIPYNTPTALTFGSGSERFDTHDYHSTTTNTSRITPGLPGTYRVGGTGFMAAPGASTDYDRIDVTVYKNGSEVAPRGRGQGVGTNNTSSSNAVETFVTLNGTTDYVELYIEQQNSAGSGAQNTSATAGFRSVFYLQYYRPI